MANQALPIGEIQSDEGRTRKFIVSQAFCKAPLFPDMKAISTNKQELITRSFD